MNLIHDYHPLYKPVTCTRLFDEWLDRFKAATTFEEKFGLLETGLTLHDSDPCMAISYYFMVADGSQDERFFEQETDRMKRSLRAALSVHALRKLEKHYFALQEDDEGETHHLFYGGGFASHWSPVKYTMGGLVLFETILSFCTERRTLPNLGIGRGDSPLDAFALSFARWMLERAAGWSPERTKESEVWMRKIYERAAEETPRALQILRSLGKEADLLRFNLRDYPAVLEALHERILNPWGTGRDTRASLEEAYDKGDSTVELYQTLQARYERQKRKEK